MVDAVRSTVEHARRGEQRASKTHREWAGAFHTDSALNRGTHTNPSSLTFEEGNPLRSRLDRGIGRVAATDPLQNDDENGKNFVGPRGAWKGEYTVAHLAG